MIVVIDILINIIIISSSSSCTHHRYLFHQFQFQLLCQFLCFWQCIRLWEWMSDCIDRRTSLLQEENASLPRQHIHIHQCPVGMHLEMQYQIHKCTHPMHNVSGMRCDAFMLGQCTAVCAVGGHWITALHMCVPVWRWVRSFNEWSSMTTPTMNMTSSLPSFSISFDSSHVRRQPWPSVSQFVYMRNDGESCRVWDDDDEDIDETLRFMPHVERKWIFCLLNYQPLRTFIWNIIWSEYSWSLSSEAKGEEESEKDGEVAPAVLSFQAPSKQFIPSTSPSSYPISNKWYQIQWARGKWRRWTWFNWKLFSIHIMWKILGNFLEKPRIEQ